MSGLGPEARSILNEGRDGDDPSPADRARVRKNLSRMIAAGGAASAASLGKTAAAATSAHTLSTALVLKVLGGALVAGALGGGAWVLTAKPAPPAPSAVVQDMPAPTSSPSIVESPSPAPPAPTSEASAEPSAAPASAPAPRPVGSARAPARPAEGAGGGDTLEEETRRLREAHASMQSGDAAKALQILEEESATHAGGQLREERAAARVLALCKVGKVDEARAAAAAFLRDNPRSPLADRVRGGCPAAPPP